MTIWIAQLVFVYFRMHEREKCNLTCFSADPNIISADLRRLKKEYVHVHTCIYNICIINHCIIIVWIPGQWGQRQAQARQLAWEQRYPRQRKIITRRKQHHHSGKDESKIRIQNMILPRGKEQHRHLNKNLKTSRMVGMNSAVGFALQMF